ncbi:MAG: SagB/ThcOx family dehydrogenase [Desulfobacterales bacterium]|nr:SagB/ThcOx family dehydrogenase [Desulfobacterales bacterium]
MNIRLPEPRQYSKISLEESLARRRSVRDYTGESLSLAEVSQLLWAAQGITVDRGGRTAPSAGALYPLELYVFAGNIEKLAAGIYHYRPKQHELVLAREGDLRGRLAGAALGQDAVRDGAIALVFTAVPQRTTRKYGRRGIRYIFIEAGHAAQNVCLQATALGLGAVIIGAYYDDRVSALLGLSEGEDPLYIIPVGRVK